MISTLHIQRFKCFNKQKLKFKPLTLLAGANATGKSSVIQSLLLLKQSNLERGELALNGHWVNVGTANDALYVNSNKDSIAFSLTDTNNNITKLEFSYPRGEDEIHVLFSKQKLKSIPGFTDCDFTYLMAERLGPRSIYPMSTESRDFMTVGIQGEYTAHCLAKFGNKHLNLGNLDKQAFSFGNPNLAYPGEDNLLFKYQTELWMRRIIPNLDIQIEEIAQADQVRIGLRNEANTSYWRPTNTGFGISYTLPIVVAALMAKPGSMLIIENPEAHLHPASQSEMGRFLARTAAAGTQVIIETHSDHILNGIRLAVRRDTIKAEDVSLQYFTYNTEEAEYEVLTPKIDEDGRIDFWPNGFFDQTEKDLMELF